MFKLVGSAAFVLTVNAAPALTAPPAQTTPVGDAVALPLTLTGGTAPFAWTATGLPTGLTVNATTGVVSGTPITTGTGNVTVTVTDKFLKTATATFAWTVIPKPTITTAVVTYAGTAGSPITALPMTVSSGTPGYTWTATGLPPGVTISGAGVISGTPTTGSRFVTVVTVTDSYGLKATKTFIFNVAAPNGTYVRITAPLADRNDAVNATVSVQPHRERRHEPVHLDGQRATDRRDALGRQARRQAHGDRHLRGDGDRQGHRQQGGDHDVHLDRRVNRSDATMTAASR